MKAAIELRGRRVGPARHPFLPVSAEVRAELEAALDQAGAVQALAGAGRRGGA
jgi:dihydrodipicolinate synthase/N-acetylneuraminate lyase